MFTLTDSHLEGRWKEIRCLLSHSPRKNHQVNRGGSIKSDGKFSRKNVPWAKQDHITKISIDVSHSKNPSLKRSDWIAPSFALYSSLVYHSWFTILPFTVIHSNTSLLCLSTPPSHSLSIHQSATLHRSLQTLPSYFVFVHLPFPFPIPLYSLPEPSSSVSPALFLARSPPPLQPPPL